MRKKKSADRQEKRKTKQKKDRSPRERRGDTKVSIESNAVISNSVHATGKERWNFPFRGPGLESVRAQSQAKLTVP